MDLQSYNEKEAEFENKEYGGFHHPNNHTSENLNFFAQSAELTVTTEAPSLPGGQTIQYLKHPTGRLAKKE